MIGVFILLFATAVTPQGPPAVRAWDILKDGIANKDAGARAKAVHALGLVSNMQAARRMAEKALNDTNRDVRVEAATSLGRMGAFSSRPKLRLELQDKDVKVVIASANALYQLKDSAAFEVYYALLTGERKSTAGLIQSQLDILRNRSELEKLMFETGIGFVPFGGMGYETWKTMTRDDASPIRAAAAEKLATDPDTKSGRALSEYCTDKKWQVRVAVINAIARRHDPALLDPIITLLQDENPSVRYDAAATVVLLSRTQGRRSRK